MLRMKTALFGALCAVTLAACAPSPKTAGTATGAPLSPAAAALLEQVPAMYAAQDAAQKQQVLAQLGALDSQVVGELCGRLSEQRQGDDAKARAALYGLTVHLTAPGFEEQRRDYALALVKALKRRAPAEVRQFLVQQLRLVGGAEVVATLGGLLCDDEVGGDAAQALLSIQQRAKPEVSRQIAAALLKALPKARGTGRVGIVNALGQLRVTDAAPALRELAAAPEGEARLAALDALANIGDPAAEETLVKAAAAPARYERAKTTAALMLYARRLAQDGRAEPASRILRGLIQSRGVTGESQVQAAALRALVELGADKAWDDLLDAARAADPQLRNAALDVALTLKGEAATARWLKAFDMTAGETRADMLRMFARRGDATALPAVRSALKDADPTVRSAAIAAAAQLGGAAAVPDIVAALAGADKSTADAAREALARIPGDAAGDALAQAIAGATPQAAVVLIGVLAQRRDLRHLDLIAAQTRAQDRDVRVAAIGALGAIGSAAELPQLVGLLAGASSAPESDAAEKAVAALCRRLGDSEASVAPVLDALALTCEPAARAALLRVLARIGGDAALAAVRREARSANAENRDAAVRALADWSDAGAADDLLAIAAGGASEIQRVLALRGYFRVVGLPSQRTAKQTLDLLRRGMELARTTEDKRLALAGLGNVKNAGALKLIEPHFADPALQSEAIAAALKIVGAVKGIDPAVATAALQKALDATQDPATRKQIQNAMPGGAAKPGAQTAPARQGAQGARGGRVIAADLSDPIDSWEVSPRYAEPGKPFTAIFDVAFPPEQPGAPGVVWTPVPAALASDPSARGAVNLGKLLGGTDCAAYLRTRVWSPKAQEALFEASSDDGLKVWLNGRVIDSVNEPRSLMQGVDKVKVTLNEGWNELLLKVTNGKSHWSAVARLRAPDGTQLDGVRADAAGK